MAPPPTHPQPLGIEVLDMGNGRYDFSIGGEEDPGKAEFVKELLRNPSYAKLVKAVLGNMVNARVGALPTLRSNGHYGYWHRDAYSLFEDEALDVALPTLYLTLLIPLVDLSDAVEGGGGGGGGTEFVAGSHRLNFTAQGVTDRASLEAYTQRHEVRRACIFLCQPLTFTLNPNP